MAVRSGSLPRASAGSGNPLRMEGGSSDRRLYSAAAIGNPYCDGVVIR
jgi:hypothetical protein